MINYWDNLKKLSAYDELPTYDSFVWHPFIPAGTIKVYYHCKNKLGSTILRSFRCCTSDLPYVEEYVNSKKLGIKL